METELNFHNQTAKTWPLISCLLYLIAFVAVGCGGSSSKKANESGQVGFDQGMASIKNGDWEAALDQFESVLNSGSVNPDQIGELYAYQGLAFAHVGKFDQSAVAIENAKQGADQKLVDKIVAEIKQLKRPR